MEVSSTGKKKRLPSEINVVPYIDVMLVLLVIFMVTAPLLVQGVKVDLPKADAKQLERRTEEPLVISVNAEGKYYLDSSEHAGDNDMELPRLRRQVSNLFKANPQLEIVVRGDMTTDYQDVVALLAVLQGIGVTNLGLITLPPETQ